MQKMIRLIFVCGALMGANTSAVIISGGDGSGNTNAPADDPGWNRVGHIVVPNPSVLSTVTYLGDKWFITAYHVQYLDNPTEVLLNGANYLIDAGSWQRITNNPVISTNLYTDLSLFQVTTRPDVLPLRIMSFKIPFNASVVMIGAGRNRENNLTYWDNSWLVTNAVNGVYSGYVWAAGSTMRWGQNTVSSQSDFDDGFGEQYGFQTTFNAGEGSNECQGAVFDSGGAVFFKNEGVWELAGIMLTVDAISTNQPSGTAVYGNKTYMADLSYYRAQITNQIVNFDSDIDGLPDWWELQYSGTTTGLVASADSDGDEFTHLQEWSAETNPTNSASFLKINSFSATSTQTVGFQGSTNRQYRLFSTTNLMGSWAAAGGFVWGTGTNSSITVTNTEANVFYRLYVTLP